MNVHASVDIDHFLFEDLNSFVKGDYDLRSVEDFLDAESGRLHCYTVVVGAGISFKTASYAGQLMWSRNIPFVYARY